MNAHLDRLFAHMTWADRRMLGLLRGSPDPAAMRLFAHVLGAERVWLLRLRGEDAAAQAVWPELSLEEMEALAEANAAEYARFLAEARPPDAEIEYRNTQGVAFRTRVDDVLLHVATHGAYHRGQAAAAVRRSGGEPLNTDLIAFVREVG